MPQHSGGIWGNEIRLPSVKYFILGLVTLTLRRVHYNLLSQESGRFTE